MENSRQVLICKIPTHFSVWVSRTVFALQDSSEHQSEPEMQHHLILLLSLPSILISMGKKGGDQARGSSIAHQSAGGLGAQARQGVPSRLSPNALATALWQLYCRDVVLSLKK